MSDNKPYRPLIVVVAAINFVTLMTARAAPNN